MGKTIFRGILNEIKRRPEDAAKDLNIPLEELEPILSGERALPFEIIQKASQIWPVNERDFFGLKDDCPDGVRFMRAGESEATSRVMDRAGAPYYEYRDTAMSSVGPFRPEWIKELCVVDNNDPENPAVQWNNGHFMHQFTYFIGPVNFYYKDNNDKKQVAVMNTGDSMYISPYVPHTFTTRKNEEGEQGLILALTYRDTVAGDAHHELMALGQEIGTNFFLDFETRERSFGSLLEYYLSALSMPWEELAKQSGISQDRVNEFKAGTQIPEFSELGKLSRVLGVNLRDLLPNDHCGQRVFVKHSAECREWTHGDDSAGYTIRELTSVLNLPHSKGLEVHVNNPAGSAPDLKFGLHQYCYNIGDTPLELLWELGGKSFSGSIEPGDSYYMKPFVSHSFKGEGKLITLRIGGSVAGSPMRELSNISSKYAERVINDTTQWFDTKGKS